MTDPDALQAAIHAGARALANVVDLPKWMQVKALGHDMTAISALAVAAAAPFIRAPLEAEIERLKDEHRKFLYSSVVGPAIRAQALQEAIAELETEAAYGGSPVMGLEYRQGYRNAFHNAAHLLRALVDKPVTPNPRPTVHVDVSDWNSPEDAIYDGPVTP